MSCSFEPFDSALLNRLIAISTVDILKPPEHALKNYGEGWLLIDDIVDTGATVRAVRKLLPKAFFATLYARSKTKGLVDLYLHEAGPDVWIDFPWER